MTKRILFFGFLCFSFLLAKLPDGLTLNKSASFSEQSAFTYSNISNWSFYIPFNHQYQAGEPYHHGATYPKGTAKALYWDGFIWGGYVDSNRPSVGGKTYNSGLVPGWVETGGDYNDATVADPTDPAVRVYRIRSDFETLTHAQLISDAADFYQIPISSVTESMTRELMDQYELDWEEWPGERGAPYYDHDQDGIYTPYIDEPGLAQADQVTWYAMNDYNRTATTTFSESDPIGLEYQLTSWAYAMPDNRLGQVIFWSHKLINRSDDTVTDMYMGQWCDPEIGEFGDDLIGCDPVLDLGFAYNGQPSDEDYDRFDMAPPAVGYDMLQGAIVESPGDTAYIDLKAKLGYENLGMTSFVPALIETQSGPIVYPENYTNLKYYNLLRGYRGNDNIDDPTPWYVNNDTLNSPTKFPLSGDPVDPGSVDIDGTQYWMWLGDRRFLMSTGPFDFAPGDTQEVVMALLGGVGYDNLGSLLDLKINAGLTKVLFNEFCETAPAPTPGPPKNPNPTLRYFEKSILIEWGSDQERVEEIESFNILGYQFEGYNVYQLPGPRSTIDDAVRIATFDLVNGIKVINDTRYLDEFNGEAAEVPVAYGDDTGIQRYIKIDWDHVNDCPLYEGKGYFFGVTAYDQNLNEERLGAKMYESPLIYFYILLQEELPGNKLQSYTGQSDFQIEHILGSGEGHILVKVVDPYEITGDDYSVRFDYNNDSSAVEFSVWNETDGLILSQGNPIIQDTLTYNGAPIVEGLEIKVISTKEGLKSVKQYDSDDNLVDDGVSILEYSMGPPGYIFSNQAGECNQEPYVKDFDRFNVRGNDDIEVDFTDSSVAWQYYTDVCLQEKVPFAMYRRPNGSAEKERLYIVIFDDGWRDSSVEDGLGIWDVSGVDDLFSAPVYEPIYAYVGPEPYDPAKEAAYIAANNIESAPSSTGWGVYGYDHNPAGYPIFTEGLIVDYYENSSNPYPNNIGYPAGYKVIFETNKTLSINDEYRFSTAGYEPVQSDSLLYAAIDRINVFPNPYYGYDEILDDNFGEYVTFTHLPGYARIRIFNLAGILVKTLVHDNTSSQFEPWHLENESGIRVGSGMYIAHIDMPDIDREKILKVMIVRGGLY